MDKVTPKLERVIRLDSLPLEQTYYTAEGYLKDRPILTRTGIFEYKNADGTVSRELRLPEDVFSAESLGSYKGKPIIVTHDAGLVNKDNVHDEQIGTILTEGYRSGDDVRAEIIIHDVDAMKQSGLRELSLGYNLDLEYTPGEWNGEHYDAIQRNIRINHLALVQEARAGEQARLNIDSRDGNSNLKGEKSMKKTKKTSRRADGILSQEQLASAIEQYKLRRAQRIAAKADEDVVAEEEVVVSTKPATVVDNETDPVAEKEIVVDTEAPVEEQVEMVKDRRDRRDSQGDPANTEEAMAVIAKQDEDLDVLFDIIDTLLAEKEFDNADAPVAEEVAEDEDETVNPEEVAKDEDTVEEIPANEDEEEVVEEDLTEDEDEVLAEDEEEINNEKTVPTVDPKKGVAMNADSVDSIVRQRVQLGMVGRLLNMDGLENMNLVSAKKAVIKAVKPGLRLDGKSSAYINAAFDCAVADVKARSKKDTKYQKKQMFSKKTRTDGKDGYSASSARQKMIERQYNKEGK